MGRVYAGILGALAFLTCLARGVLNAWSVQQTLWAAWTSLLGFAVLGSVIGWIAERILEEELRGRMAVGPPTPRPETPTPEAR